MLLLDPTEITVNTNRYRKDMGDIESFAKDMYQQGVKCNTLSNLVSVIISPEHVLIAGGRRYAACKYIKENIDPNWKIKAEVALNSVTEEHRMQIIEIVENKFRKDFSWEEDVQATKDLHEILLSDRAAKGVNWSGNKTAKELGMAQGGVATDLKLAEVLSKNPEVFKGCNSKQDAIKVLKQARIDAMTAELAKRAVCSNTGQLAKNMIFFGDCKELIKSLPTRSIYAIIADPMYGVGMESLSRDDKTGDVRKALDDSTDWFRLLMEDFAKSADKVLAEDAAVCMFTAIENIEFLNNLWRQYGFNMDIVPMIWHKVGAHAVNTPNIYFGKSYEFIVYGLRGNATLLKPGVTNVLSYPPVSGLTKQHPYEKPIELMDELIARFVLPGQTVLDFMCGRATTIISAIKRGCKGIGIENNQEIYNNALLRIEAAITAKNAGTIDRFEK